MRKFLDNSQKGAVLVFAAIMLPMLVFFGGMALDFGRAYLYKSAIQNAADSAALAGVAAAAGEDAQTRLIDSTSMPTALSNPEQRIADKADEAADYILRKDVGETRAAYQKLYVAKGEQRAAGGNKPDIYYYRIEMAGNVALKFARFFLPDSLLPNGFPVKVYAVAMAGEGIAGSGLTLLEHMQQLEGVTFNDFYDVRRYFQKMGYSTSEAHKLAQQASLTNKGILYGADGTRSEVFDMDGNSAVSNAVKKLFINFKPDIKSKDGAVNAFTENWDISDLWGLSAAEIRDALYDEQGVATQLFTNWLFYNETITDPTANGPHEGATVTWDAFFRNYVGNGKPYSTVEEAVKVLTSRIESIINVTAPYRKDAVPEGEVYLDEDGEENPERPLFVRIESEEFNETQGGSYVTNSVRKISINIKADNLDDAYRPVLFFYDGPRDIDQNTGAGRASQTVTVNLEANFKGFIYAPNSPVYINGSKDGTKHKFQGIVVAKSLVRSDGSLIDVPSTINKDNAQEFQELYRELGLSDAVYDDFGLVGLVVYKNPEKDVFFLTDRAAVTK